MPYQYITNHWHLPKELNRRVKLLDSDKAQIKKIYKSGLCSIGEIARKYGVSKRAIQFVLFPDRAERNKQLRAERGGSKRYYDKERNRIAQKDTRNYKQQIYLKIKQKGEQI